MRNKRGIRRVFDDPFLNGLITLAVLLFAVYASYFANNGLPFASNYKVFVDVPDSGQLVRHAEVRVGGARVGQVLNIKAMPGVGGAAPYARLELALKPGIRPLPVDSHSEVRVASILGGKYLSLVPGDSSQGLADHAVLALSQAKSAVDLDEAFRVFDPPTRKLLASGITELGNAVSGRGVAVNQAIAALGQNAGSLQRVLGTLADPRTDLAGFLGAAAAATRTLTPVAAQLATVLQNGDTTLAAVNAAGDALQRSTAALPGAIGQSTTTLTHLRPALAAAAAIGRDMQPAARYLPATARDLDRTLRAATPVATHIRTLAAPLRTALRSVNTFAGNRDAIDAIHVLGSNDLATFGASGFVGLGGILSAVAPAQMACNTVGLWAHNFASVVADGDAGGAWVRLLPVLDVQQMLHTSTPASNLHINAYPNENSQECEAGNEPYSGGQSIGNPAGNQSTGHADTRPPAGVTARAARAGLLRSAR